MLLGGTWEHVTYPHAVADATVSQLVVGMKPAPRRLVDKGAAAPRRVAALHAARPPLLRLLLLPLHAHALHGIRGPGYVRGGE